MDYERDTTEHGKSSRRNWRRGKSASNPGSDHAPAPPTEPNPAQDAPTGEIPTLFELPDCTADGIQRRQEGQVHLYDLHRSHSGPPASHLDPPSGNFSKLAPKPPNPPGGQTPTVNLVDPGQSEQEVVENTAPQQSDSTDQMPERVAAYRPDDPPRWADSGRSTWHMRAGIGLIVLALVTLAYTFGKRSQTSQGDDDALIAEMTISEDDSVVVISDEIIEDDDAIEQVAADLPESHSSNVATAAGMEHDTVPQTAAASTEAPPSTEDLLARIADASQSVNSVAETRADTSAEPPLPIVQPTPDALSEPLSAPVSTSPSGNDTSAVDQLFPESIDTVVSYRENLQHDSADEKHAEHDLPQGMADRLKLEDGLRYTDTPYPIGNFLEILKAWEASELR